MKDATELDLRHSRRVTAALGRSNVPKVLQVLGQMHRQEVEANVFHYSAGIHTCEKANEWQTAILLLQQMLDHRIAPDAVVCNATMSVLEKSSQWHTALDLMVQLAWLVVEADTISFNSALSGLAASKNWRDAMHLAQVMDYTGVAPSSITSNSLIDALEHWPRALQLLKQLPQRRRTLVTYNSLISACGPSDPSGRSWTQGPGAEPNGPMQSAWPLAASFLSMSSLQVQPDVISYNATISACEKSCEWRLPLHLLQHLDADVVADVVSCSGAICACQKVRDWELAHQLMWRMPHCRVGPNSFCRNSAIVAADAWPRCLQLAGDVEDLVSCNALLLTLMWPTWPMALHVLHAMPQARVQPNLSSFSTVLMSLDRWPLALQVMSRVTQMDVIGYNSLLNAHKSSGWRSACEVLTRMPSPTVLSYSCAISACELSDVANCSW
ncbi:unnamed protein product [Cladocopium goreaui]|uniref:Pentatricopeptide repeat-containing protein, chloroplastic n=1 Tax=Cladocopium goreaui TaxID=2562237 RepID=A0A9P1D098_9DINO|nr:unnamed protein product [Cladocopium goreaui]